VRSRAPESEVPAERAAAGGGHRSAGGGRAQPKNVEVVDEEGQSATVLLDEAVNALWGVGAAEAKDAWVPDQDTSVFVPAEAPTTSRPSRPCWTNRVCPRVHGGKHSKPDEGERMEWDPHVSVCGGGELNK